MSLKRILHNVGQLVPASARKRLDDRAPSTGAALAHYTAFSIAPLLVIVIAIAGLTVGHDAAQAANPVAYAPYVRELPLPGHPQKRRSDFLEVPGRLDQSAGARGIAIASGESESEFDLRACDRNDPQRVFRLDDPAFRRAFESDPAMLGDAL
jgi:hypothetical protein